MKRHQSLGSLGFRGCGPEMGKRGLPESLVRSMCTFLLASFSRSSWFGKLSHPAQSPFHKRQKAGSAPEAPGKIMPPSPKLSP